LSTTVTQQVSQVTVEVDGETTTVEPSVTSVSINVTQQDVTVTQEVNTVLVQSTGLPGPKGDHGDVTEEYSMTSGENIISLRAVRRMSDGLGYHADSATQSHATSVVGIATQSTSTGGSFTYTARGELTDPSWSWSDGEIFVGANGALTQTPPTSGFIMSVGHAIGSTSMFVDINQHILLE